MKFRMPKCPPNSVLSSRCLAVATRASHWLIVIKRRSSFPLKYFSFFVGRFFFSTEKSSALFFFDRFFFVRKIFARIFSWGGLGGRSRSNHFKKFAKANFLKWCRGGVWGGLPPQESPLPVPCPPGGSGRLRPPGISVNYPCLASAAAVPCFGGAKPPIPVPCPPGGIWGASPPRNL